MGHDATMPPPRRKITNRNVEQLRVLLARSNAAVLVPGDKAYDDTITRWSRAAEKPAGISIVPTCAAEISAAIKYAKDQNLDVAVRGGGHSTAGTSSTDGGLLFDLSGMRKVRVDAEKRLIYAQGGCLWGHIDDAAWEHRLATVGGTVADTGIGGLTLGGGYGHLTGKYGLVSDCVEEIEVVLANGDIVRANEQCHPNLFWGLLGAGQNFGVCTEFVYRAYPQGDMFLGHLQYPATPDVVAKVIDALNDLYVVRDGPSGHYTNARGRSDSEMCIIRDPDSGKPMLDIMTCINDTASQGRELYKALYDIGPVADTMSTKSYPASNAMHDVLAGSRNSMKGAGFTLPMRAEFVNECVAEFVAFTSANPDAADGSCIAWCIHDPVQLASSDRGSFANRGWHHSSVALLSWTMTENDEACRGWGRKVGTMFKAELERSGEAGGTVTSGDSAVGRRGPKGGLMMYGNYDQYGEKAKDLFGEHYERLQQIKARYDETNMFNKLLAVTPAANDDKNGMEQSQR